VPQDEQLRELLLTYRALRQAERSFYFNTAAELRKKCDIIADELLKTYQASGNGEVKRGVLW
jgi:hypothetical protein